MPKRDRWAPRHDYHKIDLAFIVDCTGSMGSYIQQAQKHLVNISETIARTAYNVHLALIEYRDHPPQDSTFVARAHDFTADVKEMKGWVDKMEASGGGDWPESVADALKEATKLTYRKDSTKMCVLIADAPPHGLDKQGDGFPNGCPSGHDPLAVCHLMAQNGITLYTIGCEPSVDQFRDFLVGMAAITGGQYVPLHNANLLSKMIINGALEEVSLEQLMGHVDDFVQMEIMRRKAEKTKVTVNDLANSLAQHLQITGNKCQQLQVNDKELDPVTKEGQRYSAMHKMSEASVLYEKIKKQNKHELSVFNSVTVKAEPKIMDGQKVSNNQSLRMVRKSLARKKIPQTQDEITGEIIIVDVVPMEI